MIAGAALAWSVGFAATSAQNVEQRLALENQADAVGASIESRIDQYIEVLYGLEGLFTSDLATSRAEFNAFLSATDVTERLPGFQALEWAPVVQHESLDTYENSVREDTSLVPGGYESFNVHPSSDNLDHIVVEYIVPMEGNEPAFGFDLGTNPARRAAIEQAVAMSIPVATPPITLVQESGDQKGLLILVPVIEDEVLAGLVLAVFRVGDLLDGAVTDQSVALKIVDVSDGAGDVLFGVDPSGDAEVATRQIIIGTRVWEITVTTDHQPAWTVTPAILQIAVVMTTIAIVSLVVVMSRARDRAEGRASVATDALHDEIRSKDQFIASVSHELRTPLTAVLGLAEELRAQASSIDEDERTELLGIVAEQTRDISGIVEDLLVVARAEIGEIAVTVERVDLVALATHLLATTGIQGAVSAATTLVAIGDPARIRQILRNLLTNAVRYGGTSIRVTGFMDTEFVHLDVRDDGPAVDASVQERIFSPYQRGHFTPESTPDSVGLGLTVSRTLAELMAGSVTYRHDGSESIFRLSLPRS